MKTLSKDVTFIYSDSAEKAIFDPLVEEAKKRGYQVKLTDNKFEKCEIGVYCQHVNFPQYSKFSVIMLHDIIQQYSNWPDLWFKEPWNKYDIGILPSDRWVENWNQCSHLYYAVPRKGMYKVGWPKADKFANIRTEEKRNAFYEEYGLDKSKKTVLYAPAWENDGKQDEFVQAMLKLDVNILIKQWDAPEDKFPHIVKNIREMAELHKDIPGVTVLNPAMNIFEAIAVSDLLVSEESSTMCEAIMMGVPAVSVSNWMIPDVTPSRYPQCDYDFVIMTKKEELSECVNKILKEYPTYKKEAEDYSAKNFSNIGQSSKMIMDIIDDCVAGNQVRYPEIKPNPNRKISFERRIKHMIECLINELFNNYRLRYKSVEMIYKVYRALMDIVQKRK